MNYSVNPLFDFQNLFEWKWNSLSVFSSLHKLVWRSSSPFASTDEWLEGLVKPGRNYSFLIEIFMFMRVALLNDQVLSLLKIYQLCVCNLYLDPWLSFLKEFEDVCLRSLFLQRYSLLTFRSSKQLLLVKGGHDLSSHICLCLWSRRLYSSCRTETSLSVPWQYGHGELAFVHKSRRVKAIFGEGRGKEISKH